MLEERCFFDERCPVKGVCFRYPEYIYEGVGKGCLFAHIIAVIEKWDGIKRKYLSAITRLFRKIVKGVTIDTVDRLVTVMLILHDYGKAAKEYLTTRHYYHEIPSASVIHEIINYDDIVASLISSAVFLHHEHRIYRELKCSGNWRIDNVVIRRIVRKHVPKTINVDEHANEAFKTLLKRSITDLGFIDFRALRNRYERDEIEKTISNIVSKVTAGLGIGARNLLMLGMLNHILVVTDIRAANVTRKETRNKLSTYFRLILHAGRTD